MEKAICMNDELPNPDSVPVLILAFNRPDKIHKLLQVLRQFKPAKIYISIDGPRLFDYQSDSTRISYINQLINTIDWDCDLRVVNRITNYGCKRAVEEALNMFFQSEEYGLILEDDCLPTISFLKSASNLLCLYKYETIVGLITGHNRLGCYSFSREPFFLCNTGGIQGWASWRRAWRFYDPNALLNFKLNNVTTLVKNMGLVNGSIRSLQLLYAKRQSELGLFNSWAYAWGVSRNLHGLFCLVPKFNMVYNIGLDAEGTHTSSRQGYLNVPTYQNYIFTNFNMPIMLNRSTAFLYDFYFLMPKNNIFKPLAKFVRFLLSCSSR